MVNKSWKQPKKARCSLEAQLQDRNYFPNFMTRVFQQPCTVNKGFLFVLLFVFSSSVFFLLSFRMINDLKLQELFKCARFGYR